MTEQNGSIATVDTILKGAMSLGLGLIIFFLNQLHTDFRSMNATIDTLSKQVLTDEKVMEGKLEVISQKIEYKDVRIHELEERVKNMEDLINGKFKH